VYVLESVSGTILAALMFSKIIEPVMLMKSRCDCKWWNEFFLI